MHRVILIQYLNCFMETENFSVYVKTKTKRYEITSDYPSFPELQFSFSSVVKNCSMQT